MCDLFKYVDNITTIMEDVFLYLKIMKQFAAKSKLLFTKNHVERYIFGILEIFQIYVIANS